MLCEKPLQKIGFRRALLLMKPAHTGHHPGAVPGFRPSPGNSEETTTRVLTEEISVLFRVPTWDPTHPGSPVSRALPGNTPTQGPTREGKPGFFLGGGGNPGRNPGHGLGKTRERGGFRVPGFSRVVLLGVVPQAASGYYSLPSTVPYRTRTNHPGNPDRSLCEL